MMEFHVSRRARDRYQFDLSLYSFNGNVIFANFHAARVFAQKINQKRDLLHFPEQSIKAGQINAMGLIDEILHYIISIYREQKNPDAFLQAFDWLNNRIGSDKVERTLKIFTTEFPPLEVYLRNISVDEYLEGVSIEGISNRCAALEELLMLWLSNKNPAFAPYLDLFSDNLLESNTSYLKIIKQLITFFDTQPDFGPDYDCLIKMLRSPSIVIPHSLFGQLEYIRERWGELLGHYLYRLLSSLDLIKEEEKFPFLGHGPIPIPAYAQGVAVEPEHFSPDRDWMPNLVLIAKNIYVWLYQISRKYQRSVTRLDQIPDEELDTLANWGFSGLWLIGLWERSKASSRIKQLCGNPEAIASAYSLESYEIASDLGGEGAYYHLRECAWQRGIRLASDMVPNHMGIDSTWIVEHPDWFISLDHIPFPAYTFTGLDLSPNDSIGIFLEDRYYDHTDAAVVFKRVDRRSGHSDYIYHGNDGTSMPWNDTAQLNYLKPEVREAVIQNILCVARKFPIIRFDAAMTLTKQHYKRLWFPDPGSGGDIPSRSEHSLTKASFDAHMPVEFWREVVDRVAIECPDTLLLAEAFWLMEGFFVRTLGMHRVYNSAFMNLLRDEDNAKYRLVMKKTLEFNPEILKRFVNFLNNPDERTAIEQFGNGDKYFGICTLLATSPGLPMFGHGQIEGYTEKYGMEYFRAYWDEQPNFGLIERHEREIFPLLRRRELFSGIENFLLYDFYTPDGLIDENVFAYSNSFGNDHSLVVYNNKDASTCGWIHISVCYSIKSGSEKDCTIVRRNLGECLNLHSNENNFVIARDHVSGMEYIHSSAEIFKKGMYLELDAYKYHVFLDIHEVIDDTSHSYLHLFEYLNGRGVPSIEEALNELLLKPVQTPFHQIANSNYFRYLISAQLSDDKKTIDDCLLNEAMQKYSHFLDGIEYFINCSFKKEEILTEFRTKFKLILSLCILNNLYPLPGVNTYISATEYIKSYLEKNNQAWLVLFGLLFVHHLGKVISPNDFEIQSQSLLDEWHLGKILASSFQDMNIEAETCWRMVSKVRIITGQQSWYEQIGQNSLGEILKHWLAESDIQKILGINRYKDILWFNKEAFEEFVWWMMLIAILTNSAKSENTYKHIPEFILDIYKIAQRLLQFQIESEYQVSKLIQVSGNYDNF